MNMDYYQISAEELGQNAKVPLLKLGDSGEVFYELALEMIGEIEKNNAVGRRTVFICPVGPVGQYPIFVRLVNERRLSLKNCWFINMDEYLTDDEEWIDERSPLSFHGFMNRTVYSKIDPELVMPENQRIFPDPHQRSSGVQRGAGRADGRRVCGAAYACSDHQPRNAHLQRDRRSERRD